MAPRIGQHRRLRPLRSGRRGRKYVQEHGPLSGGASDPASVVAAINNGCNQAFDNDVQDNITVVQAITQG